MAWTGDISLVSVCICFYIVYMMEILSQTVFTRLLNQVPEGTSCFVDGILGHHSIRQGGRKEKM